jgi:hypothetical protein
MTKRNKQNIPAMSRKTTVAAKSGPPLWLWLAGGGVVAVLLVAGLFYLGIRQTSAVTTTDIEGVVVLPDIGAGHQEGDLHDDADVPAGGVHNAAWQNCGIYAEPVREENVVHSLEHGAVWLAYQPELAEAQVEILRQLVRNERSRQGEPLIVLAPKPGLQQPIVATAWRVQLELDNVADARLAAFVEAYQRGPFTPEPQANCVNGVGEPLN